MRDLSDRRRESEGRNDPLPDRRRLPMKCKDCQKKIAFDHYLGTTGPVSNGGNIQLVFKCDCGFYMVPFALVQISKGRGLISSGKMKHYKIDEEETSDGKKLSQEGLKIFNKQGEKAYDQWTKEVFLPLMDAKLKRLRACSLK
jgi:hypothetical protein